MNPRMVTQQFEQLIFHNVSENGLSVDDVSGRMLKFVAADPRAAYQFVIGTDCQVHRGYTKFVTGIILRRMGKGAWACYRQVVLARELTSVQEKLSLETALSQEAACYFSQETLSRIEDVLLPYLYQGASLETYIDIDAGTQPIVNKTSLYVEDMVNRVKAMGTYGVRVKPDAYAASAYANRHTKRPVRLETSV
ncbi:ribonuclease H-like YkuK family protein [Paenibacillus athensensis]|uniref:Uncharacterized protein n=1 Tax=Paenibacillus athensensis TaxID=1967502 RepID=A0A4Y8PXC6_9BACL|nr:ribonuclease H-like YkuK family protein [Paenibacillus athensensis]MCD1260613.1 ribonuclease H-like YkuK family protein [Paenibacillus athensensis]